MEKNVTYETKGNLLTKEAIVGNYFVSTYPPFSCWTQYKTLEFQEQLNTPFSTSPQSSLGLYIHIPFCAKRCNYCYYLSHAGISAENMKRYLSALHKELMFYAQTPSLRDRVLDFVYIGGGTPSLLSDGQLAEMLDTIKDTFHWNNVREVTFECAPQSVTKTKLGILHDRGVSRISMGVQQVNDDVLLKSGRIHSVSEINRAYEYIRHFDFEIINIDLITGLPGETDSSFRKSLEHVIEMSPESVTIYQLEIPYSTPLYHMIRKNKNKKAVDTWATKQKRLAWGFSRLEQVGYTVRSAYAAVKDNRRHGFVYQDEQYRGADILGVGASSFSFIGGIHHQNTASFQSYIDSLEANKLPLYRAYCLSKEERFIREFILQLKLGSVENQYFWKKFRVDIQQRFGKELSWLAAEGWIKVTDEAVFVTREGLLRVDRFLPDFYLPEHQVKRYS